MFSHVGGDCRDWGERRKGSSKHRVCLSFPRSCALFMSVCMDSSHMSYVNYIRYNYIMSFAEDANLGKSNHATQFLFKVSALKLLYRIKNKIKIATDVQRNSQTLVNCEVMKKMADAASHLPSHPTFPPRMDQGTGSVDITPSLCGDQPVLLSCLPGRHLLGLDL